MMVSIDRAGRIVVPKEIRDHFDLGPDAQLELEAGPTGIHLRPVARRGRVVSDGPDGLPIIQAGGGRVTTDSDIQQWRDGDQR